jgi:transcriptional regulator with XRE-family HTH domain
MKELGDLLKQEMEMRDWSLRDLADEAGISSHSTLAKYVDGTVKAPRLDILKKISLALKLPLRRLVTACGYEVDDTPIPDDEVARIESLLRQVPELRTYLDDLAALSSDDRAAALAMTSGLVHHRKRRDR